MTPVLVVSDTQVSDLRKKGIVTVRETATVLNCPIIKVGTEPSVPDSMSALEEPVRRRLYGFVSEAGRPVGRDEAAAASGISRSLAAYHLDKLAEHGLLEVTYRRPSGQAGPGVGRPAKPHQRQNHQPGQPLPHLPDLTRSQGGRFA